MTLYPSLQELVAGYCASSSAVGQIHFEIVVDIKIKSCYAFLFLSQLSFPRSSLSEVNLLNIRKSITVKIHFINGRLGMRYPQFFSVLNLDNVCNTSGKKILCYFTSHLTLSDFPLARAILLNYTNRMLNFQ